MSLTFNLQFQSFLVIFSKLTGHKNHFSKVVLTFEDLPKLFPKLWATRSLKNTLPTFHHHQKQQHITQSTTTIGSITWPDGHLPAGRKEKKTIKVDAATWDREKSRVEKCVPAFFRGKNYSRSNCKICCGTRARFSQIAVPYNLWRAQTNVGNFVPKSLARGKKYICTSHFTLIPRFHGSAWPYKGHEFVFILEEQDFHLCVPNIGETGRLRWRMLQS